MRFIIRHINLFRQKRYKKIIAYLLINRIYATLKSNIKNVINLIYQRSLKLILLKFSFFKKC